MVTVTIDLCSALDLESRPLADSRVRVSQNIVQTQPLAPAKRTIKNIGLQNIAKHNDNYRGDVIGAR